MLFLPCGYQCIQRCLHTIGFQSLLSLSILKLFRGDYLISRHQKLLFSTFKIVEAQQYNIKILMLNVPDSMDTVIKYTMRTLIKFAIPFFKSTFGNQPQILRIVKRALDYFGSNILKNYLEAIYASVQSQPTEDNQDNQGGLESEWEVWMQVESIADKILNEQSIVRFTNSLVSDFPEGNLEVSNENHSLKFQGDEQKLKEQNSSFNLDACINNNDQRQQSKQYSQSHQIQNINQQQQPIFQAQDQLGVISKKKNQSLQQSQAQKLEQNQNENGLLKALVQNQDYGLVDPLLAGPEQLNKKKKKKKGKRSKGLFVKQKSKAKKLNLLKELHFQRIKRMKQKYANIKVKLFPKQLQVLWLFKLTDEQIKEKIMNCNKSGLKNLRNQFRQWREQLQKRSLKVDQTCHRHKNKIFYICLHQTIKRNAYLCNQCFQDKKKLSKQYTHEIICKQHRKIIKYQKYPKPQQIDEDISSQEQQFFKDQQQKYLCQQCQHNYSKRISSCHYQEISLLCIQQKCVQMGVHMICPVCQSANHEDHNVVEYNKDKLMDLFKMPSTVDVAQYEQLLIKVKGMLSFSLFQKLEGGFAEEALPILRFLEAFGVYSSEEVEKRINKFIAEQQRENLMVLTSILNMKKLHSTQESRLNYLQVLNSMLEGEFEAIIKFIQERLKQFCVRMKGVMNRSKGQVEAELNGKYRQIINIEVDDQLVNSPMRLTDVHPLHYRRIQKIIIKKEGEQQRDQNIERERRNKRVVFFKQISNKLLQQNVGEQYHQKYIELILSQGKQFEEKYSMLTQEQRKIIISLMNQYNKASSSGNPRECLPLEQIMAKKFSRLRAIHIQYLSYQPFHYSYSVNSFALFEFIGNNAQLNQVTIKGVQISKMQQFIKSLSRNGHNLQKIKKGRNLRLAINFQYPLLISSLQNLSYFGQQLQQLSQVTVEISFKGSDYENQLMRLLLCLKAIKKIKIKISNQYYPYLDWLLSGLAPLTEVTSLSFDMINDHYYAATVSKGVYSSMEESLTALFARNTITHLIIYGCYHFPSLLKITTLQYINFVSICFKDAFDLSQFIKANTKLKHIHISNMEECKLTIEDQLFNQLQYLSTQMINSLSIALILPSSPSKLKYLSINNKKNNRFIDLSTLQPIFPKLANIIKLQLTYLDFGFEHLSSIPSNHLEKLYILGNNKITDECLQLIDSKWPYLKDLALSDCSLITERILSLCKFKGLMRIYFDRKKISMLGRKHLMKRGIQLQ